MGNSVTMANRVETENVIKLIVNGELFTADLSKLPAHTTLNNFIREYTGLTGTKFMCLEGGCGACVCVLRRTSPTNGEDCEWAVNSCLTLLAMCDGLEVITVEGIGDRITGFHPIQKRLAQMNGTQCGYCSPGMVMNMYGLLQSKNDSVTMRDVEDAFSGNLCRCTGYRPILDAMKSFATDSNICVPKDCGDIEDLVIVRCPKTGTECRRTCRKSEKMLSSICVDKIHWYYPTTLNQLNAVLVEIQDKKYFLASGNTSHGVYRRPLDIEVFVDMNNIPQLQSICMEKQRLVIGSNVTITSAIDAFKKYSATPGFEYLNEVVEHFLLVANVPVRNTGTLAGNLMIKHNHPEFPSDVFLVFECLDVKALVGTVNSDVTTVLTMTELLFVNMLGKVILCFYLQPYPKDTYLFGSYKIMPRAQNAHAFVNASFLIELRKNSTVVASSRICFGGINPGFVHAINVEQFLLEKSLFAKDTFGQLFGILFSELYADSVLPQTTPKYRKMLACGLLYKFLLKHSPNTKDFYKSGGELLKRPLSSGTQTFDTYKKYYPVTMPIPKLEALVQCSGEAKYSNDLPSQPKEVWAAFVLASKALAKIEHVDASGALAYPGVVAFYSAADIPGKNTMIALGGFITEYEELFGAEEVKYYGQPIGVVVAETNAIANIAARKVKVLYSSVKRQTMPTMKDVLKSGSVERIKIGYQLHNSCEEDAYYGAKLSAIGKLELGLQYHFTMEPQTTVAIPTEGRLDLHSSVQTISVTQQAIAELLKMKQSDIQLHVRRLGGGYGAKVTRGGFVACAAALAAVKLNRPVRFVQSIESMMDSLGKRWACYDEYNYEFDPKGKVLSATRNFFEDAGWSGNESPLSWVAMRSVQNCYNISNNKVIGSAVLTDAPSNTWCRAPGSVEGVAMIENTMEHIAFVTGRDPVDVRLENISNDNTIRDLVKTFLPMTEYANRKKEIKQFNAKNRWRKRGMGICFMEFPLDYIGLYTATVAIYNTDGTVIISHGGIEMGQGINTKAAQVAAYTLGIPLEMITVDATNSVNGANNQSTAGSATSESVSFAVQRCCETLNKRLEPVRAALKIATWPQIIQKSQETWINLIASESFKIGDTPNYIIHGLGLTEVEVDILTGNSLIRRVDILEDVGQSLSPLVDVGQIEGAFVMGLGYWLTEKLVYDRTTGELLTNRTWDYKVPGAKDIPIDFRVNFVKNSTNVSGFMRSKATGEPAVSVAVSVMFAIRQAILSARDDAGLPRTWVRLGAPTTPETIVLQSGSLTEQFVLN